MDGFSVVAEGNDDSSSSQLCLQQQHYYDLNHFDFWSRKNRKGTKKTLKKGDSTEHLSGSTIEAAIDAVAAKGRSQ